MTKWKQLGSINLLEIEKNNPINLDAQLHYGELEIKNATYIGQLNSQNKREGIGRHLTKDCHLYEGQF